MPWQAYLQSDLNLFYSSLATNVPVGYAPTLNSIDGGVAQTSSQSFSYNGESDLDLEYAIALGKFTSRHNSFKLS
jgi:tripeptidyl-peptidase-1